MPHEVEEVLNGVLYRPVRWRSAFEETVERLAQAIKLGAVRPGSPLPPERDLVNRLRISRTTLREAIRALQQDGYLETRRGRAGGTFVAPRRAQVLTYADARRLAQEMGPAFREALDVRAAVEPKAAELAAGRADRPAVERLRSVLTVARSAPPGDSRRWDSTLHIAIAQAADSPLLLDLVLRMQMQLHELLAFLALPELKVAARRSSEQHERIVEAIARGDARGAREAMDEHVRTTHELLASIALRGRPVPPGSRSGPRAGS
jgi:DNA-binding FadR family transcriptional regulator